MLFPYALNNYKKNAHTEGIIHVKPLLSNINKIHYAGLNFNNTIITYNVIRNNIFIYKKEKINVNDSIEPISYNELNTRAEIMSIHKIKNYIDLDIKKDDNDNNKNALYKCFLDIKKWDNPYWYFLNKYSDIVSECYYGELSYGYIIEFDINDFIIKNDIYKNYSNIINIPQILYSKVLIIKYYDKIIYNSSNKDNNWYVKVSKKVFINNEYIWETFLDGIIFSVSNNQIKYGPDLQKL